MRWLYKTNGAPACTKLGVKRRDGACVYCGGSAETVDHVLPRSRGGGSTWLNLVAACYACNSFKADRTPAEAGMLLHVTPHVPQTEYARTLRRRAAAAA